MPVAYGCLITFISFETRSAISMSFIGVFPSGDHNMQHPALDELGQDAFDRQIVILPMQC